MTHLGRRAGLLAWAAGLILSTAVTSQATVRALEQARKAGAKVKGCLDCHASPHAREVMERKAHDVGFMPTNCQGCHGGKLPKKLNAAGDWLVEQKKVRGVKVIDGAWLKDYVPAEAKE